MISCAKEVGMHFIGIPINIPNHSFTNSIPQIIIHSNPVSNHTIAANKISIVCPAHDYPWEKENSLFFNNFEQIKAIMSNITNNHLVSQFNSLDPLVPIQYLSNKLFNFSIDTRCCYYNAMHRHLRS